MSLSSANRRNDYTGNGVASTFSYTFKITATSDLLVKTRLISTGAETALVLNTDYTVSGVTNPSGGIITLLAGALPNTKTISIRRIRPLTQLADIKNAGDFYPETHENVFDNLTMIDQQQQDELDRSIKLPTTVTSASFNPELPAGTAGAISKALTTNASGTGFADPSEWPSASAINTASSNAISAADSAASASTSAAAALVSKNAASTSALNAAISASQASTSASGAQSSQNGAATSENNAISSAAAALASQNAAATSATTATTQAGIATTGASTASTQAGIATTQAGIATTQAGNAAASASALALGEFSVPIRLPEVATPSTPASGFGKVYFKSDNALYQLNDLGIERKVGAGGSGTKNYITDGDFENNNTTGWSLCTATMSGVNPTGTLSTFTAASITTFAATATNPLAGAYSLNVATSAAWTAGQGYCSSAYSIDREDRGRVLTFKFFNEIVSGLSNLSVTGTTTNTLAIWIYDVTNGTWTQPSGCYGITGTGFRSGEFQLPTTCLSFRIVILAANASAGAASLTFDDFGVGPQVITQGTPVTDWASYSPATTGGVNTATILGKWRRVGDTMEVVGSIEFFNTPTAFSFIGIGLPSGAVIDTNKLSPQTFAGDRIILGDVSILDSGLAIYRGFVSSSNTTAFNLYVERTSTGANPVSVGHTNISNAFPISFGNNDIINWRATFPIVGWSSNVQMSSDTDTRVVAGAFSNIGAPQAIGTSTFTKINYNSTFKDSHGAFNSALSRYVLQIPGTYEFKGQICFQGGASGSNFSVNLYKNGTIFRAAAGNGIATVNNSAPFVFQDDGVISDFYEIFVFSNVAVNVYTQNQINGGSSLNVNRLSGPSQIARSEDVTCKYHSATTVVPNNTATTIVYNSKLWDSHGATYNTSTGVYTALRAGKINVVARLLTSSLSAPVGAVCYLIVLVNGAFKSIGVVDYSFSTAIRTYTPYINCDVDVLTGDQVVVRCLHNLGSTVTAQALEQDTFVQFRQVAF